MANKMNVEAWRGIAGWPAYQVSNQGRVRSLPRIASDGRYWEGKLLSTGGSTYPMVALSNGVTETRYVHLVVLEAFHGPCPSGLEGCHNDGDKANCRASNLRWDTRAANAQDRTRHGTEVRGERMHNAKLTAGIVKAIRRSMLPTVDLARRYGVAAKTLAAARSGKTWRHVGEVVDGKLSNF